jgi:hypothetical protein
MAREICVLIANPCSANDSEGCMISRKDMVPKSRSMSIHASKQPGTTDAMSPAPGTTDSPSRR